MKLLVDEMPVMSGIVHSSVIAIANLMVISVAYGEKNNV